MNSCLRSLALGLMLSGTAISMFAGSTVIFPKAGELPSPDGRFLVRNAERQASQSEFLGTFHSLWLIDSAGGEARKLCDYVGLAAARWSDNEHLVITEYVGNKSSRALLFSTRSSEDPVMLDKSTVIALLPTESRTSLRDNDHVFVEAIGVRQDVFALTVWGNGQRDRRGFRWRCNYNLRERSMTCTEGRISH